MVEPRATAPRIAPTYGVPTDGSGGERLPWSWAAGRLTEARNYWICTTRAGGRPHAMPVWGVWFEDALWFGTSDESVKGRNLARSRELVVHLESGDDVVILEGAAEVAVASEACLGAYEAKYGLRPPGASLYVVRPRVALTWREADYPTTAARWIFG
jgi:hypothetical protein